MDVQHRQLNVGDRDVHDESHPDTSCRDVDGARVDGVDDLCGANLGNALEG